MKIGKHKINNPTCLAPMSGITNIAFRVLCKKYGAGLVYSEFVHATALTRKNEYAIKMMKTDDAETPVAIQLFGTNIKDIQKAVKLLHDKCDIIDFNFGCPSHKVTCTGAGATLMNNPDKIKEIVKAIVSVSDVPVTVKMRTGIDDKHINVVDIAKKVEKAGASAIAVHGRTLAQGYGGSADWNIIKKVKDAVSIPVIGNGDVVDEESAKRMIDCTGVDAVMIGRAAMGNPFIFSQVNYYLKTGKKLEQKNNIELFYEYLDLWEKFELKFSNLKMHVGYFTKGIVGGAKLRRRLVECKDVGEIKAVLLDY